MVKRSVEALVLLLLAAWPLAGADAQGYCAALGAYYPHVRSCPGPWYPGPSYVPGYVAPGYVAPGYVAPGYGYVAPGYVAPGYGAPGYVAPGMGYPPGGPDYEPPSAPAYGAAPPPPPPAYPPPGAAYAPPGAPPQNLAPRARESTEEQANANRDWGAEIGMRREQDQVEGFNNITVGNALTRFKTLGGGFVITGYYARSEQLATLADHPSDEGRIFVVPDKLPRAGQNMLSSCQNCRITIWAKKGCAKSALGEHQGEPCLVIERVKKDTYEANTTIYR